MLQEENKVGNDESVSINDGPVPDSHQQLREGGAGVGLGCCGGGGSGGPSGREQGTHLSPSLGR